MAEPVGVETFRGVAYPWLCDSMGHMNTQFYATLFDGAGFHFLSLLGPYAELTPQHLGWADVRQVIEYKHEVRAGTLLVVRTELLRVGGKSVEYLHRLSSTETGALHATSQLVTVLFDLEQRRAAPLLDSIRQRAASLMPAPSGEAL